MGRVFFNGAQTICCLKLAIAFHTQDYPDQVSHRSSLRVEQPRPNRVCCCLIVDFLRMFLLVGNNVGCFGCLGASYQNLNLFYF